MIIYKYRLNIGVNMLPIGEVRLVGYQNDNSGLPTLWIEHHSPPIKPTLVEYFMRATGEEFDHDPFTTHVGSAICGRFVWHVYRRITGR